ncbi:MAG: hypothetical protein ACOYL5_16845 [Phototrophicaceae bacterium]|jgi:hypothetical protein
MSYIDTWRGRLKDDLNQFAPLAKDRPHLDPIHSLIGAALCCRVLPWPLV